MWYAAVPRVPGCQSSDLVPYASIKGLGGVYGVFLSVGDYFFAMYPFCVGQKGVGPTGKGTS